jgi:hypothetical protein
VESLADRFAEEIATKTSRRRFIRLMARTSFITFSLASVGQTGQLLKAAVARLAPLGDTCSGPGLGCPGSAAGNPCGPSRCCNYVRPNTNANCDCATDFQCHNGGTYCFGNDGRAYPDYCWTCHGPCSTVSFCPTHQVQTRTTCCDCKTSASLCNDPDKGSGKGRCIRYQKTDVCC